MSVLSEKGNDKNFFPSFAFFVEIEIRPHSIVSIEYYGGAFFW